MSKRSHPNDKPTDDTLHKKKRLSFEEDRLSSLPDVLLIDIISLLDIESAVATSVLSRRWRFLWTYLTDVRFTENSISLPATSNVGQFQCFCNTLEHIFLKIKSPKLHSLSFHISLQLSSKEWKVCANFVQRCIHRAICSQKVEKVDISISCIENVPFIPTCVFENSCLEKLRVCVPNNFYTMPESRNIRLPNLKELELYLDDSAWKLMLRLFKSCPLLEVLSLRLLLQSDRHVIDISAHNLKSLDIFMQPNSNSTQLVIHAPKLEHIKLSGAFAIYDFVEYPSSLVEAELDLNLPKFEVQHVMQHLGFGPEIAIEPQEHEAGDIILEHPAYEPEIVLEPPEHEGGEIVPEHPGYEPQIVLEHPEHEHLVYEPEIALEPLEHEVGQIVLEHQGNEPEIVLEPHDYANDVQEIVQDLLELAQGEFAVEHPGHVLDILFEHPGFAPEVGFEPPEYDEEMVVELAEHPYDNNFYSKFSGLMQGISNVRSIHLHWHTLIMLNFLNKRMNGVLPVFPNLIHLAITDTWPGLLAFPDARVPASLLSTLKIIDIKKLMGTVDEIIELLKYILSNAPLLEKLKVSVLDSQITRPLLGNYEFHLKLSLLSQSFSDVQFEVFDAPFFG